ncbi:hypothetical protein SDC9_21805 [bioreactor metagenome]|uniref:Uncharacterized protein n=1 Tax=bioreactor metagenome TaxID=1076179 RepID=A0A644UAQ9_9ZZZZ|nr:hypothetical protein [Lentimicrobium sp.]MEA5111552.1 hypothetical protein [Lentimicrobium sp.]
MQFIYYSIFFITAIVIEMVILPVLVKIPLIPLALVIRKVEARVKFYELYHSIFYWFIWEYFIDGILTGFILFYLIFLFNLKSDFDISSAAAIILAIILTFKDILSWKKDNPANFEFSLWGSRILGYIIGLFYFNFF